MTLIPIKHSHIPRLSSIPKRLYASCLHSLLNQNFLTVHWHFFFKNHVRPRMVKHFSSFQQPKNCFANFMLVGQRDCDRCTCEESKNPPKMKAECFTSWFFGFKKPHEVEKSIKRMEGVKNCCACHRITCQTLSLSLSLSLSLQSLNWD